MRFPGAEGPRELWKLLCNATDATGDIPSSRWDMASLHDSAADRPGKIRNRRAGLIQGVETADPHAFRLPKRELRQMDPQHRVLLECAWHALEDAGIPFDSLRGSRTGVFMGVNFNDFQKMLSRDWNTLDGYALLGTTASFAANRISYAFDLRGPSSCSSVGCVSSTVALHDACRSLALGEVELALAGGVDLMLSPDSSIMLSQAGVFSVKGQCRTLAADADGYIRGEGAGVVVLKPLSQVDASDRVYAVIRGSAVNHNGRNEWIMATSASAQEEVILQACEQGGVEAASLDYVELHGSAFSKGDEAEAIAIGAAFGKQRPVDCRLGAVSNNLGYLGAAGGIAQLIKVCLSLYHRTLPPTIHVDVPNPNIPFKELGLRIQSTLEAWPERGPGQPRRAGVVTTSLGGTNTFVVLEAAPDAIAPEASASRTESQLLVLSALTTEALRQRALQLKDFLSGTASPESLDDLCFTAAFKREHHRHRAAVIAKGRDGLVRLLGALVESSGQSLLMEEGSPPELIEAARVYADGGVLSRDSFPVANGRCVDLPLYPFQRQRLWPEWLSPEVVSRSPSAAPASAPTAPPPQVDGFQSLQDVPVSQRESRVVELLRGQVAEVLGLESAGFELQDRTFFELGMNSVGITLLKERISRTLGVTLPTLSFFEHPRPEPLAKLILTRLESRTEVRREEEQLARETARDEQALVEHIAGLSEDQARELLARKLAELNIEVE
ncbi:beta-ketoacyl synthase N-terminal-like domain-containing protein [Melittangium boletus]